MTGVDVPCRRAADPEMGASAVEFALLFPLFIMLCVGMISFGFAFEKWISVTQAARETSRFAATYPPTTPMTTWLDTMGQSAAENAGIDLTTTPISDYFICVRFVNQVGPSATPATVMKTWGTLSSASTTCTGSTLPDNRVEVKVQRKASLSWIFGSDDVGVSGTNTSRFEPRLDT
jgi:Flp pilus assembly protein TadG